MKDLVWYHWCYDTVMRMPVIDYDSDGADRLLGFSEDCEHSTAKRGWRRISMMIVVVCDDNGSSLCHCIQQKKSNVAAAMEICHRYDAQSCVICTRVFSVKTKESLCALQTGAWYKPLLDAFWRAHSDFPTNWNTLLYEKQHIDKQATNKIGGGRQQIVDYGTEMRVLRCHGTSTYVDWNPGTLTKTTN